MPRRPPRSVPGLGNKAEGRVSDECHGPCTVCQARVCAVILYFGVQDLEQGSAPCRTSHTLAPPTPSHLPRARVPVCTCMSSSAADTALCSDALRSTSHTFPFPPPFLGRFLYLPACRQVLQTRHSVATRCVAPHARASAVCPARQRRDRAAAARPGGTWRLRRRGSDCSYRCRTSYCYRQPVPSASLPLIKAGFNLSVNGG